MAVTLESPRELRGLEILSKGDQIERIDADHYIVKSQSGNGSYAITRSGKEWTCECSDHLHRQTVCKHIWGVYFSLNLRRRVVTKVQPEIDLKEQEGGCVKCRSQNVVKIGIRHNMNRDIQRLKCKECGTKFSDNEGFERIKATPRAITLALDSYFKGNSQRDIVDTLKNVEGIEVTQPAVHKWIRKYIAAMKEYLDKFTPQLGAMWHSDETIINVRKTTPMKIGNENFEGQYSWMWNLMDHETRFLIASEVTKHREIEDARKVLSEAKDVANGQRPDFVITDKLPAYKEAITKEFYTNANPKTQHVRLKNIKEGTNNNIIERLHGTIKERTKVMRGMDTDESAKLLLEGQRLHYNYLRPHMGLKGKTPAEAAGIDLKLEGNKWEQLIKRAKRQKPSANSK
ncbi:MAG: IS1/IS6 family transposase [Nitrososphaerota archaeon]|nr:IS1/IS6 family transposase [Nitrososphaerota archaeon]